MDTYRVEGTVRYIKYIKFEEVLCHRQIDNFTNRKYVIENIFLG